MGDYFERADYQGTYVVKPVSDPFEDAPDGIHLAARLFGFRHVIHLDGTSSTWNKISGWRHLSDDADSRSVVQRLGSYGPGWEVRDSSTYEDPFAFGPVGIHLKSKHKKRGWRRLRAVTTNGDVYQWNSNAQKWEFSHNGGNQKQAAAGYGSDHWITLDSSTYAKENVVKQKISVGAKVIADGQEGTVSHYDIFDDTYRVDGICHWKKWYSASELRSAPVIEVGDTVRTLVGKVVSRGFVGVAVQFGDSNDAYTMREEYLELVEKGNEPIVGQQYVTTTGAVYLYLEDGRVAVILDSHNNGNEGKIFNRPSNYRTWKKA